MNAITKKVEESIREGFYPYMLSVTNEDDNIKIVMAAKQFEGLGSDTRINDVTGFLIEAVPEFNEFNGIKWFLMSEKEYRHAISSPTFNGI